MNMLEFISELYVFQTDYLNNRGTNTPSGSVERQK